jgi:hypothetical protein
MKCLTQPTLLCPYGEYGLFFTAISYRWASPVNPYHQVFEGSVFGPATLVPIHTRDTRADSVRFAIEHGVITTRSNRLPCSKKYVFCTNGDPILGNGM